MAEEIIRIGMMRENLENIPQYPLPEGYCIRRYKKGYEKHWRDIHLAADMHGEFTSQTFAEKFGSDTEVLAQRQCYLVTSGGDFVGTATAWSIDEPEKNLGQVHYVAIIPDEQGRGLAKPLLTIVCNRLRELGHTRGYLTTQTVRTRAINLYAQFGFVPYIPDAEAMKVWSGLQDKLKKPFDIPEKV